jgi:flagellin
MIGQGALYKANDGLNKSLEKLSTGLRINRASDDAAGLSVSENLRAQVRGLGMAKRNAQDGIALLQIAEGAMNEISDILQRMRELAVQSTSDTLTSTERTYTNQEYVALKSEVDRIAAATQYNGQTLVDATANRFGINASTSSIIHIGANNATTDEMTISLDTMTTLDADAGLRIQTTSLDDHNSATYAIGSLDAAIDFVNGARSDVGAYVNRLEHAINNIINQEYNQQAADAVIRDTDFALETANFTKNQILTQSSTAMLANANMVPQTVLALLGR